MGQKTHPYGFRLGVVKTWTSKWYEDKNYARWLHEDLALRKLVKEKFSHAGIAGIMTASGLAQAFSGWVASVAVESEVGGATEVLSFLSAAVVNLFVPSGGGQWGVQGPVALEAGAAAGVAPGRMIMAVAYGDQLTNMLQPFWALPLLAITGVKAREVVGYTAVVMLGAGVWVMGCLVIGL